MRCADVSTCLFEDTPDALSDAVRRDLDAHLRDCPTCAADAEVWRRLNLVEVDPSDATERRRRFDVMLAGYRAGEVAHAGGSRWFLGAWAWRPVVQPVWTLAAAAAALVVGVGLGWQATRAGGPQPNDLQVLRDEVRDLRQMVSLSLLQQQSASERLKGVAWAAQLESDDDTVVAALLNALSSDSNVNVRLASVDALKRFATHDAVRRGAVAALGRQTSPLVQIALIDFVVEAGLRDADGALRRLAADANLHEAVRSRAELGLRQVS